MRLRCPECGQTDQGFVSYVCFPVKFDSNGKANIDIKQEGYDIEEVDGDYVDVECLACHYMDDISCFDADDEWITPKKEHVHEEDI